MKKTVFKLISLILALSFAAALIVSCGTSCTHKDSNNDNLCDLCGEKLSESPCTHSDGNGDGICDLCGKETVGEQTPTVEELLEAAEAALAGGHYKIVTRFSARCSNPKYSSDISALFGGSAVEITIQNNNIAVNMPGDMSVINIRIVEDMAYLSYLDYECFESLKIKSILNSQQREELWNVLPTKPRLSVSDFTDVELSADGKQIICQNPSDSVYEEISEESDISGALNKIDNVTFSDAKMTVSFNDGKYDSLVIDYSLGCDIDGEQVEVNIRAEMTYAFENADYVISPDDASSYKLKDFDALMSWLG